MVEKKRQTKKQLHTIKKHVMNNRKLYATFISLLICGICFCQKATEDSLAKRHQQMMDIIMAKPKTPIKTIGILVYNGYQTLDVMGPYETLANLSGVQVFFVAKQKGLVSNQRGMKLKVDTTLEEVTHLDILVIPGGAAETFLQTQDTATLNWIRKIDKTSFYTTSVCTGAWILGATGLLNGKNVTTNWYRGNEIMKKYGANFKNERWVRDGKYWTSAGVTAGIDMSLAIINELMGEKYAQGVMLNLEYNPHPPILGGSITNTQPIVKDMMLEMYDMGLKPLFKKYKF